MKYASLFLTLLLSVNVYAEKCEGINSCSLLYTKLTGDKLVTSDAISDEMTLGAPDTDLTNENARSEFPRFLNKNVVQLRKDGHLVANREGEFLSAPIYVVSVNNMPQMINKDGAVTLVYHAKKDTNKLVTAKVKSLISAKKKKSSAISHYNETKIIAVSGTFEHATKAMNAIMKADK